jgi:hypothetical protein
LSFNRNEARSATENCILRFILKSGFLDTLESQGGIKKDSERITMSDPSTTKNSDNGDVYTTAARQESPPSADAEESTTIISGCESKKTKRSEESAKMLGDTKKSRTRRGRRYHFSYDGDDDPAGRPLTTDVHVDVNVDVDVDARPPWLRSWIKS